MRRNDRHAAGNKRIIQPASFLYLDTLLLHQDHELIKEYVRDIPAGMLQIDERSIPVISDFVANLEAPYYYMMISYGFHYSDFKKNERKPSGISFHLNPPFLRENESIRDIVMCGFTRGSSTFTINGHQYFITNVLYNLDKIAARILENGETYRRIK